MSDEVDPLAQGAARPLPTRGEGCLQRYDPDELSEQHGTDFPGASDLWRQVERDQAGQDKAPD